MASKRFQKKVYECWALEDGDALAGSHRCPYLWASRDDAEFCSEGGGAVRVRVTVERIERKKVRE